LGGLFPQARLSRITRPERRHINLPIPRWFSPPQTIPAMSSLQERVPKQDPPAFVPFTRLYAQVPSQLPPCSDNSSMRSPSEPAPLLPLVVSGRSDDGVSSLLYEQPLPRADSICCPLLTHLHHSQFLLPPRTATYLRSASFFSHESSVCQFDFCQTSPSILRHSNLQYGPRRLRPRPDPHRTRDSQSLDKRLFISSFSPAPEE